MVKLQIIAIAAGVLTVCTSQKYVFHQYGKAISISKEVLAMVDALYAIPLDSRTHEPVETGTEIHSLLKGAASGNSEKGVSLISLTSCLSATKM